jgi:hypothetical protein
MPARNRLLMPLTLKQLFPSRHLRISRVANLVPSAVLTIRHVRTKLLLGNDALKSNSRTRWNNAVPERSICSAYRK